jgi:hypothetical protein
MSTNRRLVTGAAVAAGTAIAIAVATFSGGGGPQAATWKTIPKTTKFGSELSGRAYAATIILPPAGHPVSEVEAQETFDRVEESQIPDI